MHKAINGSFSTANKPSADFVKFRIKVKKKSTFRPKKGQEGPQGLQRYSSTLSLTSALDGGGWLTARPSRFTSGKETLKFEIEKLNNLHLVNFTSTGYMTRYLHQS
jgi:hypothetical protein